MCGVRKASKEGCFILDFEATVGLLQRTPYITKYDKRLRYQTSCSTSFKRIINKIWSKRIGRRWGDFIKVFRETIGLERW